jgi:molecular chaperone GrpE
MRSSPGTESDSPAGGDTREELREELEQTRARLGESEDRYLRSRADLDNYRKRSERELERRVRERGDELLRAWLEVVDSVERALALEPVHADDLRAFLEQMQAILARQGATRIGQAGEPFDPERHEAVAVVPDPDRPAGTVAEVARSGYAIGDRVVRPAQVAVAQPPADGS